MKPRIYKASRDPIVYGYSKSSILLFYRHYEYNQQIMMINGHPSAWTYGSWWKNLFSRLEDNKW